MWRLHFTFHPSLLPTSLPTSGISHLGPAGLCTGPLEISMQSLAPSPHLSPQLGTTWASFQTLCSGVSPTPLPHPLTLSPKYLPKPFPVAKTLSLLPEDCGPSQCLNNPPPPYPPLVPLGHPSPPSHPQKAQISFLLQVFRLSSFFPKSRPLSLAAGPFLSCALVPSPSSCCGH